MLKRSRVRSAGTTNSRAMVAVLVIVNQHVTAALLSIVLFQLFQLQRRLFRKGSFVVQI